MRKKLISVMMVMALVLSSLAAVLPVNADELPQPSNIPAFPGAEGAGMYTSGGRGGEVYIVTNLNDSGEGSLRDAISKDNRIVVFAVSGTIYLESTLSLKGRKNITIAGQTAPGDGITIANYGIDASGATNCIIRYLRVRPGSANISTEPDAFSAIGATNLMIDHISASWSTDETMSFYDNKYTTIQWCIIGESLTISGHVKGKHGYGGIWGGPSSTFHHNVIVSHSNRLPRFAGLASMTYANNVVYNWGGNNSYGGTESTVYNVINNYYKAGPSSQDSVKDQLANPGPGIFYFSGNILHGNDTVTKDNYKGLKGANGVQYSDTPFENFDYTTLTITDAQTAYEEVLAKAGAIFPRRDAVDARLIQDIKNGTGRLINREFEVGGYPEMASAEAPADTDKDGMPDEWEIANGLNPNDPSDASKVDPNSIGYTYIEQYINSLVGSDYTPDNPEVTLLTPEYNDLFAEGAEILVDVNAFDADGIAKVEFFVGSLNDQKAVKVGTVYEEPFRYTISGLEAGTYFISARAYDKKGNATQSTSMPVHVNGAEVTGNWTSVDIGNTPVKGSGSFDAATGVMTVKGSGKITGTHDSFHFVYQPVYGNASLTAKLNYIALIDNNTISGLAIRESLEPDAAEAIISTSIIKADRDENSNGTDDDTFYYTFFSTRTKKGEVALTLDDKTYPQDTLPSLNDCTLPIWLRIERVDDEIIAYTSYDNATWKELARKTIEMPQEAYIGFAVDGGQPGMQDIYYNTAKFSDITCINSFTVTDVQITDVSGNPRDGLESGENAVAVVTVKRNSLAVQNAVIVIQLCDTNGNVLGASYIQSAFNAGETKAVKAGFSTPMNLEGLRIKVFVVNNMDSRVMISNLVVK